MHSLQQHGIPERPIDMDQRILDEYSEGIGCLPEEHTIKLYRKIPPVGHPPRKVPSVPQRKYERLT